MFSIIDLKGKQTLKDKKRLDAIICIRKYIIIPKPDKDNGAILISKNDYIIPIEKIFSDKSKFILSEKRFNS